MNGRTRRSICDRPRRGIRRRRGRIAGWKSSTTRTTIGRPSSTTCGRICYQRRKINVSQVFAGQTVGVKQVVGADRQPVRPDPVTHVSGMKCYLSARNGPSRDGAPGRIRARSRRAAGSARRELETGGSGHLAFSRDGAPGRIRTCDLWLRRPTLYPAELRAHELRSVDQPHGSSKQPCPRTPRARPLEARCRTLGSTTGSPRDARSARHAPRRTRPAGRPPRRTAGRR